MKNLALLLVCIALLFTTPTIASDNSKTWDASDKAKQFVKDTIVIDFFASPYGVGWTESECFPSAEVGHIRGLI